MAFTASDVAKLREITGAGMMDCKKAMTACNGDLDKAVNYLREQGVAVAAKKAGRIASEGAVEAYIHMGGKIGVLVELNCESDFVAKSEDFKTLAHNIAMHIAAFSPKYVSSSEVSEAELKAEKDVLKKQALNEGKPAAVVDKMVEGRIKKFYEDFCLLDQKYVLDNNITVQAAVNAAVTKLGEKISVRRFTKFVMGEGLEKKSDNLAEEVAKLQKKK